jgi:hypothetical protein
MKHLIALLAALMFLSSNQAIASDHDDGEIELKGRNLNLTDLYAFQEASQTGLSSDAGNMILIMNTNPRSLPGQEYFFSTQARYEFHVSRVVDKKKAPTGNSDLIVRFEFANPTADKRQSMTVTVVDNQFNKTHSADKSSRSEPIWTTSISSSKVDKLTLNQLKISNYRLDVFAGLREDPFFFDVERFFDVRADLAAGKPYKGFLATDKASDFTKNYNVNTIVVRLPIDLLKGKSNETVYDIWETISIRNSATGEYRQIERLGRPAINEGLVLSNANLNEFNEIGPKQDLQSSAILGEAGAVLGILAGIGGQPADHVTKVVAGFLPDVMRIDSAITIPVGQPGYVGDFVINDAGAPMLTGGRKIEDDVADQTLTYLVFGTDGLLGSDPAKKVSDNVSYAGHNHRQGHKNLYGQESGKYLSPAKFPYLAQPN